MVSIHVLGVDVITIPSFIQVRGGAHSFQVEPLSNKITYFNNRGANMLFVFAAAILVMYCDAMLIRCSSCENQLRGCYFDLLK
jgi:hypothetical protein